MNRDTGELNLTERMESFGKGVLCGILAFPLGGWAFLSIASAERVPSNWYGPMRVRENDKDIVKLFPADQIVDPLEYGALEGIRTTRQLMNGMYDGFRESWTGINRHYQG